MGKRNKKNEIEGTGVLFNSKREKIISTFLKGGRPNGMTLTFTDAIETTVKYSFYGK
tara:strand:- start:158 stop:328 length:171 start_codon:yes stop_codon:yes gene_type:complete